MDQTRNVAGAAKAPAKKRVNVVWMTELALLTAIVILMAFTPLGYLKIGAEEITFIVIPVAVGAVVLGPLAGLFLGFVFGITSLLQPSSMAMFSLVPWQLIVCCIVPRLFVGLVPAYVYKGLNKVIKKRTISTAIACVLAPLTNTILYVSCFVLILGQFMAKNYPDVWGILAGKSFAAGFGIFMGMVSLNAVLEAASCLVIATAICNALWHTANKSK